LGSQKTLGRPFKKGKLDPGKGPTHPKGIGSPSRPLNFEPQTTGGKTSTRPPGHPVKDCTRWKNLLSWKSVGCLVQCPFLNCGTDCLVNPGYRNGDSGLLNSLVQVCPWSCRERRACRWKARRNFLEGQVAFTTRD